MKTVVVYVHGLWFSGREALLLRARLSRALGAEIRVFAYPPVNATIRQCSGARAVSGRDPLRHAAPGRPQHGRRDDR
jgi:hypothetical protein